MNKKLRLILHNECNRNCEGCCNNDWDIAGLPVCSDFSPYDLVLITGGEPMLKIAMICEVIRKIRAQSKAKIILYTALTVDKKMLDYILSAIDGITVTLHDDSDIESFKAFDEYCQITDKSFRLNVFHNVGHVECNPRWQIKSGIEWIKNCPLPHGEVLMKYKNL